MIVLHVANHLGLEPMSARKMEGITRKLCEPLHTCKFFYEYLWLIVEMQCRYLVR